MKHVRRILPIFIILTLLLTACSGTNGSKSDDSSAGSSQSTSSEATTSSEAPANTSISDEVASSSPEETESFSLEEEDFLLQTKDYLLHGQTELPEADQLKWSELFLDEVDFESMYQDYRSADGQADDIKAFALYLTEHAPIVTDWKELFEAELFTMYEVAPSRYEPLENDLFQVYVELDGEEVPYVVVNARTGYFHG